MQLGTVTPGKPAVERIFALRGTVGEQLLEEIAHPASQPMRCKRDFGMWIRTWGKDGHETCRGIVVVNGTIRIPLLLEKGMKITQEPRTLVVQEIPGRRLSLKPLCDGKGGLALRVGDELRKDALENRRRSFAAQILAAFVVHGVGWRDRNGRTMPQPYGDGVDPVAREKRKARKKAQRSRRSNERDRYRGLW